MASNPIEQLSAVLVESSAPYWTQPGLWVVPSDLSYPEHPYAMVACQTTSNILYILSGRKFPGLVQVAETYYCPYDSNNATSYHLSRIQSGTLKPFFEHDHRSDHMKLRQRFPLRHHPVRQILSLNNERPDAYFITDHRYLNASPGSTWTLCSGVNVIYVYGTPPPMAGRMAAKMFADELLKSVTDPESCQLPQRVTSVTRQGMSFTLLDPQDFLEKGRTGIYAVDLFLATFNPNRAQKKSKTFNVDLTTFQEKRLPSIQSSFNDTILIGVQEVRNREAKGSATVSTGTPLIATASAHEKVAFDQSKSTFIPVFDS